MQEIERVSDKVVKDHGYSWVVLASCFLLSVISTGNVASNGIFFVEYVEFFRVTKAEAAVTGSINTALSGITGVFLGVITERFGTRCVAMVGSLVAAAGYFASCMVSNFAALYVLFGIMPGLGMGCMNIASIASIMQYFNKHRALALGIRSAGMCVGTIAIPQLTRYLINRYTWRGAVLLLAGIQLNGFVSGALLCPQPVEQNYVELGEESEPTSKLRPLCNCGIFKDVKLGTHFISASLIVAGDNIPFLFLPAKAVAVGIGKAKAVVLVTILGLAGGISSPLLGFIADHLGRHRTLGLAISTILAGILTSATSSLKSLTGLSIYAGAMGILSAGYMTSMLAVLADLSPPGKAALTNGFILFFPGILTAIALPIAGMLVDVSGSYRTPFLFSGVVLLAGGATTCVTYLLQRRGS